MAKSIWGNERHPDEFLRELIRASQQDRNLRMRLKDEQLYPNFEGRTIFFFLEETIRATRK